MAKVVVVGVTGYIGKGVALAFRRAGYKVYGVVRDVKKANKLIQDEIIPIIGDISKPDAYQETLASCSIIIDAVGFGKHSQSFFEYVASLHSHKLPGYKTLYIFTSGIMTYGVASTSFVDETTEPKPIEKDVQERKQFEDLVLKNTTLRNVVLRPGFVYGGQGGFVADVLFNIKPEQDIVAHGSPDKRWSWVHVDDLGDAYVRVAQKGSVVDGQLFNIAALDNPTYNEIRLALAKVSGWKGKEIKYEPIDNAPVDVKIWEATVKINPSKARNVLGWVPSHLSFLDEIDIFYQTWKLAKENK